MPSLVILFSAVLVLLCGQTYRPNQTISEADDRYTHATTVGMSKESPAKVMLLKHRYLS